MGILGTEIADHILNISVKKVVQNRTINKIHQLIPFMTSKRCDKVRTLIFFCTELNKNCTIQQELSSDIKRIMAALLIKCLEGFKVVLKIFAKLNILPFFFSTCLLFFEKQ